MLFRSRAEDEIHFHSFHQSGISPRPRYNASVHNPEISSTRTPKWRIPAANARRTGRGINAVLRSPWHGLRRFDRCYPLNLHRVPQPRRHRHRHRRRHPRGVGSRKRAVRLSGEATPHLPRVPARRYLRRAQKNQNDQRKLFTKPIRVASAAVQLET